MATRPDDMSDPFDRKDGDGDTSPSLRDRVTVLRPRDLLAFTASWRGLTREGRSGALVAEANGGTLTITFPFQHVGEAARPVDLDPPLPPPVAARAARNSRLVFTVPAGHVIPYSIAGLLEAMSSLELAVAPAAEGGSQIISLSQASGGATSVLTRTLTRVAQMRFGPASDKPAGENDKLTLQQLVGLRQGAIAAERVIAIGGLSPGDLVERTKGRITVKLPPVRVPGAEETAIEAPFRLILSPSVRSGWVHATTPVEAESDHGRVELWHSRLATRIGTGAQMTLDELPDGQRTVRAIWTRDRDRTVAESPGFPRNPFLGSLRADQRDLIVEQTAGSVRAPKVLPTPVKVRGLALSSLGAFLDLHVQWPWQSYPESFGAIVSWDHVAPMGRDQFVRVVTPGFLYPLGHAAYLVEITYRRVAGTSNPVAGLFRRTFIVLGDPNRPYAVRDLPFIAAQVAPLRTPDLDPTNAALPFFVPRVVGDPQPFQWRVTGLDHDGRPIHLRMPMVWVRAQKGVTAADAQGVYQNLSTVPADGQSIAFAPALDGDDGGQASAEVRSLRFEASITATTATPRLRDAVVIVPAMKRLTPTADPVTVSYADIYKANGFGAGNAGQVYLALADAAQLAFGSSDRSGGFVQPDVTVKGLARGVGLVADLVGAQTGNFDPKLLFAGGFPKLFGLIDLWEIVGSTLLEHAPKFLTDELNKATALLRDLQQLQQLAESGELQDKATALGGQVKAAVDETAATAKATITAFQALLTNEADARKNLHDALADLKTKLGTLRNEIPKIPLGPGVRAAMDRLIAAIGTALALDDKAEEIEAKLTALVDAVQNLANNIDPGGREVRARMEWRPPLQNWPHPPADPIFRVDGPKPGALVLSVETRVAVGKPPVADVAAELTDFALELLPGAQLLRVSFDRIAFRMTVGRKPEIDVVFGKIEFLGVLGFVNTLAEIIPLDGFSDPPFVDVSTEGVTAGFTLGLPNLAIGIFSLSNLAIAADARIPFLGETVSVGFSFCTREKPFTLAVAFLGGGGFFGIRLSPKGVVLLEAALEFGAVVAVDFGVASGSISAMAGIYFRMEGDAASLTGYFRIRGEVDVLSLISASIELYMSLTYAFDTGKMVGEATITVHVEVLFFSTSVRIHAQRTFAGSNGDPTAAQMLLPAGGRSTIWEEYCAAFAPAKTEA